jgi:hypothetical protein
MRYGPFILFRTRCRAIDPSFQHIARPENQNVARWNWRFYARLRVLADSEAFLPDGECSKTTDLDGFPHVPSASQCPPGPLPTNPRSHCRTARLENRSSQRCGRGSWSVRNIAIRSCQHVKVALRKHRKLEIVAEFYAIVTGANPVDHRKGLIALPEWCRRTVRYPPRSP